MALTTDPGLIRSEMNIPPKKKRAIVPLLKHVQVTYSVWLQWQYSCASGCKAGSVVFSVELLGYIDSYR